MSYKQRNNSDIGYISTAHTIFKNHGLPDRGAKLYSHQLQKGSSYHKKKKNIQRGEKAYLHISKNLRYHIQIKTKIMFQKEILARHNLKSAGLNITVINICSLKFRAHCLLCLPNNDLNHR